MMKKKLMQKAGIVTIELAAILSAYDVGDRIPSITVLSEQLDVARRHIQIAIQNLEEAGAVTLHSRGRLGSYIEKIDYHKLGDICDVEPLLGVLPLPYTKRYEGLSTGIYAAINSGGHSNHIAFMRGAENRYEALLTGRYDFVIMSQLSFLEYQKQNSGITAVLSFGDQSYVGRHVLFRRKGLVGKIKKIGIDDSSMDQITLTNAVFGAESDVQFVPIIYSGALASLRSGVIDACIWNVDDASEQGDGFDILELDARTSIDSEAVLVCRSEDKLVIRLLRELIDVDHVRKMQEEVMQEVRMPFY